MRSDQAPVSARRPMKEFPLPRLLPNMITMMSLLTGLTAVRFALQDKWDMAALAIVVASIFDVLDGRVARFLNTTSKFGAELDSLADLTSFGVAPGFVLYLWLLQQDVTGYAWIGVLVFVSCSALRLARFNTMIEDMNAPKWTKSYFMGVPAPAGAGLALLPMFLVLAFGEAWKPAPYGLALWIIFVGGLMVSRLPTLSMKGRRVAPIFVAPIMVGVCLIAAGLFTRTWVTLSVLGLLYLALLPYGFYSYRRREMKEKEKPSYE